MNKLTFLIISGVFAAALWVLPLDCYAQPTDSDVQVAALVAKRDTLRVKRLKLAHDEREYVIGDGTTDPATIAARQAEFLLDNLERYREIGRLHDEVLELRETASAEKSGVENSRTVRGERSKEARREANLMRNLEFAAKRAQEAELFKSGRRQ